LSAFGPITATVFPKPEQRQPQPIVLEEGHALLGHRAGELPVRGRADNGLVAGGVDVQQRVILVEEPRCKFLAEDVADSPVDVGHLDQALLEHVRDLRERTPEHTHVPPNHHTNSGDRSQPVDRFKPVQSAREKHQSVDGKEMSSVARGAWHDA
jgi:hypothetical protein